MGRLPPLTPARAALVEQMRFLPRYWLRRRRVRRRDWSELHGVAVDALVRAAQSFDWTRGVAFVTYASLWIRGLLRRHAVSVARRRLPRGLPPARRVPDPAAVAERNDFFGWCRGQLRPDQWRFLELHYFYGMTLAEAWREMFPGRRCAKNSPISRHAWALRRLRRLLAAGEG